VSNQDTDLASAGVKPRGKTILRRLVVFSLTAFVVLVALCYLGGGLLIHDKRFADYCVLCPYVYNEKYDITLPGVEKKALTIPTGDGQTLDAWLFTVPGASKLAIVNHGNAGNLTSRGFYVQAFTAAKANVLLYDYRGYGQSSGVATVDGVLEDGMTAFQYARKDLGYAPEKIILFGESLGTAVACSVAAREKACALMLFAPIDSLPSAGRWKIPVLSIYPDFCFAQQLNNVELVAKNHAPIYVCHGLKDEILCPAGSQKIYDAAGQPKTLVFLPDSGHFTLPDSDLKTYLKSLSDFVGKLP
jgi:fermentation-respiration switch protein FrsA (DUF1100 family)